MTALLELEGIILSEIYYVEKKKISWYHIYIESLKKKIRRGKNSQKQREEKWLPGARASSEKKWEIDKMLKTFN